MKKGLKIANKNMISNILIPIAVVVLCIIFQSGNSNFLTIKNWTNIGRQQASLLIAAVGATPLPKIALARLREGTAGARIANILQPLALLVLLLACTAYLVDGSFNPFLYFRF